MSDPQRPKKLDAIGIISIVVIAVVLVVGFVLAVNDHRECPGSPNCTITDH